MDHPLNLVLGVLVALPWLARGQTLGPAVVTDELCTGCALCSQQCPYGAIEMRPRANGARLPALAAVLSNLCAGCGLCVGTCSTAGIELAGLPTTLVRERLRQALADTRAGGLSPVMVFTCQRHVALGTLELRGTQRNLEELLGAPPSSPQLPRVPPSSSAPLHRMGWRQSSSGHSYRGLRFTVRGYGAA